MDRSLPPSSTAVVSCRSSLGRDSTLAATEGIPTLDGSTVSRRCLGSSAGVDGVIATTAPREVRLGNVRTGYILAVPSSETPGALSPLLDSSTRKLFPLLARAPDPAASHAGHLSCANFSSVKEGHAAGTASKPRVMRPRPLQSGQSQ